MRITRPASARTRARGAIGADAPSVVSLRKSTDAPMVEGPEWEAAGDGSTPTGLGIAHEVRRVRRCSGRVRLIDDRDDGRQSEAPWYRGAGRPPPGAGPAPPDGGPVAGDGRDDRPGAGDGSPARGRRAPFRNGST
jgi:hypothetical protein